jgi:hypothetical protein
LTPQFQKIRGNTSIATFAKVEVDRTGSGDWVDLTNFLGWNWVKSVEFGASLDTPVMDAIVQLHTRREKQSLSPFMTKAAANLGPTDGAGSSILLQLYRSIRISTAWGSPGQGTPPASAFTTYFDDATIEDVDITHRTLRLRCLGPGGALSMARIKDPDQQGGTVGAKPISSGYSVPPPNAQIEDVIQQLLTNWGGGVTLYSEAGTGGTPFAEGDSPGWAIKLFEQQRMSLAQALKTLADQIGYDLRYRYHANTDAVQFVLSNPDRSKSTPDHIFAAPREYISITQMPWKRNMIRNELLINWVDKGGITQSSEYESSASRDKYGALPWTISRDESSQLDTQSEVDSFGNAAIGDCAEPNLPAVVAVPYFPFAQLADYYRVEPDNVIFDTNLDGGVTQFRHVIGGNNVGRTTLTLMGKPASRTTATWVAKQEKVPIRQTPLRNFEPTGSIFAGSLVGNGQFLQWSRGGT